MDKNELRQDPVREKIFAFLNYIENNQSVLIGVIVGLVAVILIVSNLSSSRKASMESFSVAFGKAVNSSISDGLSESISQFENVLESGFHGNKSAAYTYLLDYYSSSGDKEKIDSLLAIDVKIEDNILFSRILVMKGDIAFNKMDYDSAIDNYRKAIKENSQLKNDVEIKIAMTMIEKGDRENAILILENLLEDEDLDYQSKSNCERYLSLINNSI